MHERDQSDVEPMSDEKAKELIAAINALNKAKETSNSLTKEQFHAKCNLKGVPSKFKESYIDLLFKHRDALSTSQTDLGRAKYFFQKIHLKDNDPVY